MATFFARTENASNTVAALHIAAAPVGNAIGAILGGHMISRYVDVVFDQHLDPHIGIPLMSRISQDKAVQSCVHHRCDNLCRELYPHTHQMAGPDQGVGVSLHLPRQFWRWLAQLFAIRRSLGCRRETAAGNDDQYFLPQPADGNDDRGEWIGCSAAKNLSECSGKEPGGSCRDERSEYL